jgi:putative hydrolase of the HAD superfamily
LEHSKDAATEQRIDRRWDTLRQQGRQIPRGIIVRRSALLIDYGGVLTTALSDGHSRWCASEGVDPDAFDAVLRRWRTHPPPGGNPVHLVERGVIAPADFERLLAGELRDRTGRCVDAVGLVARILSFLTPEPAMLDELRRVHDAGHATVLVTNSWGSGQPWAAWSDLLDAAVVSYEVRCRKPEPDIYRAAIAAAGATAAECVFVDDSLGNVTAARQLSIRALHHTDVTQTVTALRQAFPSPLE